MGSALKHTSAINSFAYLDLIQRESKAGAEKGSTERLFLPMEREAIDYFRKFLDVSFAKPIFELLQYRKQNGLTQADVARLFPVLAVAEEEYLHHLERMRWELGQLFNLTPPYIHKLIHEHIKEDIEWLEGEIKKNNIIKTLGASNDSILYLTKSRDGEIRRSYDARPVAEKLDLKVVKSPYLEEYLELLNIFLDDFKAQCNFFINEDENSYRRSIGLKPIGSSGFVESDLKSIITGWDRFIAICDWFCEARKYSYTTKETKTKSGHNFRKATTKASQVIERLGVENYKWKGLGSPTESLRGFLQVLWDEELFEYSPFENATRQASAFFRFFKMERNYPLYVFHHFDTSASKYKEAFDLPPHLKKANYSIQLE